MHTPTIAVDEHPLLRVASFTTRETLSVIWGCAGHEPRLAAAETWYRSLLAASGATTAPVPLTH